MWFLEHLYFRPASAKSGSLDTPLYLYYSLLFSYIFILFIFQREKKERIYKREYIRGGYRGVARPDLRTVVTHF